MTDLKHWRTIERRLLIERLPWLRLYEEDLALPDGRTVHGYLRLESPGYAMIVPLNEEGQIGLVRSYKRGVDDLDLQPPAGIIDGDEHPLRCAQRELLEEAGCEAAQFHPLGRFVLNGNYFGGWAHFYLATGCRQVAEPDAGDLEQQQVLWLPHQEVRRSWVAGAFQQMSTVAALGLAFARLDEWGAQGSPFPRAPD